MAAMNIHHLYDGDDKIFEITIPEQFNCVYIVKRKANNDALITMSTGPRNWSRPSSKLCGIEF